ncbi:hypothetical protein [Aliikangiella sp. G2MR2-5]|uniref:hypothetical protein n=1 Tax=Aliikangiella sp. G2MR2-5 TaxID=2788943 RepID=UPI0018A94EA1|nr:hypothetical protein [Aliikangiella sp. G2MR2-5]
MKESPIDINQQKQLSDALAKLPMEMKPDPEVWSRIETTILSDQQSGRTNGASSIIYRQSKWFSWGMAASLVLSAGMLFFSWQNLNQAKILMADMSSQQQILIDDKARQAMVESMNYVESMDREYRLARTALLTQIRYNSNVNDSSILDEIETNLAVIEKATINLKNAIAAEPDNPQLPKLLQATYQQELALLSQLARLNQNLNNEERT